jgi:uncharacterized repeat protein (TIGR03803 family)
MAAAPATEWCFKLVPKTGKETVLWSFTGGDGSGPYAGVIPNKAGELFGTTELGGANTYGTIFEVDPKKGTETVLHSFDYSDGENPVDGLIQDSKGNFYGTAQEGGSDGYGVVFSIHP